MNGDEFIDAVAKRAGLDVEAAWRLTEETLGSLARRMPADGARDVADELPDEVGAALRGAASDPKPSEATADSLYQEIADGADIGIGSAMTGARSVVETIRETVSDRAYTDLQAQLPAEFNDLFL